MSKYVPGSLKCTWMLLSYLRVNSELIHKSSRSLEVLSTFKTSWLGPFCIWLPFTVQCVCVCLWTVEDCVWKDMCDRCLFIAQTSFMCLNWMLKKKKRFDYTVRNTYLFHSAVLLLNVKHVKYSKYYFICANTTIIFFYVADCTVCIP